MEAERECCVSVVHADKLIRVNRTHEEESEKESRGWW